MLRIRSEQLDVFKKIQLQRFVDDLCQYARLEFPVETARLKTDALRLFVEKAINNAESYQITERPDVCQFLNYMFILGQDFDQQLDWARKILSDPLEQSGSVKMLLLNNAALGNQNA